MPFAHVWGIFLLMLMYLHWHPCFLGGTLHPCAPCPALYFLQFLGFSMSQYHHSCSSRSLPTSTPLSPCTSVWSFSPLWLPSFWDAFFQGYPVCRQICLSEMSFLVPLLLRSTQSFWSYLPLIVGLWHCHRHLCYAMHFFFHFFPILGFLLSRILIFMCLIYSRTASDGFICFTLSFELYCNHFILTLGPVLLTLLHKNILSMYKKSDG